MGYCMFQKESRFSIPYSKKHDALVAIRKLCPNKDGGNGYEHSKGKAFSWVTTSEYQNAITLEEAMKAWRWEIQGEQSGNIAGISFIGEKLGDDEILFMAIAPFVEDGSYIEMHGEDGTMWRWSFEDGQLHELYPEISWR